MDFGALPPEVNSGKIYSGPGAGSMLVAAAAWEGIADELYSAASSCNATISALADDAWMSAASVAMATATAPYVAWMSATAAQAQRTAAQARAAAGAFEAAFAATVPPPVIAANRALVMLLTATNVLGVNTPAIATAEVHYGEMWAQDAAVMYGYASASAAASTLTVFTPPPEVTDPAGAAHQAAALSQVTSPVPQALQQLAQPLSTLSSLTSPASSAASTMSSSMSAMSSVSSVAKALGSSTTVASGEVKALTGEFSSAAGALPPGLFAGLAGPQSAVSAEVGRAVSLGGLSVPQSWSSTALASGPVAAPLPGAGLGSIPALQTSAPSNMLGGLPIAGMAPRGEGGLSSAAPRAGVRPTVMPRPEFGG